MEREELGGVDEESLVFLEALRLDGVGELDGDEVVPEVAEYLVNLAHLLLVLQVDGGVEVGHVGLCHLDDEVVLTGVSHVAQRDHALGRAKVTLKAAAAATAAPSSSAASTTAKSTPTTSASASEAHFNSKLIFQYFSSLPLFHVCLPKFAQVE